MLTFPRQKSAVARCVSAGFQRVQLLLVNREKKIEPSALPFAWRPDTSLSAFCQSLSISHWSMYDGIFLSNLFWFKIGKNFVLNLNFVHNWWVICYVKIVIDYQNYIHHKHWYWLGAATGTWVPVGVLYPDKNIGYGCPWKPDCYVTLHLRIQYNYLQRPWVEVWHLYVTLTLQSLI